ncbi:MAG: restriction endonuclease subunit S [Bacteroidetes bacterium]|nr:restriction endonuclease subunit S [Bacteroidota bacterium]
MGKWSKIKLGNACHISKGQQLNKIDLEKAGDYPCINGGIEPSGYTDKWNTEANTVTISEGGNSCGYVNFLTTRFWSGGHCYSLLDLKENIDVNFLYQALKGRESLIMGLRVGSGLPNIQQKAIKEFEFDYPESKTEQTRIAQILSKADAAIAQTEALMAKYQRIKTGLMQDLLTKGIDEHGNIRSEQTHRFKTENGLRVPEEWEVVTVEQFASKTKHAIVDGPFGSNLKTIHYRTSGIPIIQSGFVTSNIFQADEYLFVDKELFEREIRSKAVPGDLIMAKIGANCGTCALLPLDHPISIIAGNSLKISVDSNNFNRYLEILFHYLYANGKFDDIKSTTAQPAISMQQLKKLLIPRPSKTEQINISSKIDSIDKTIDFQKNKLKKLTQIKTGLMQDLLSGKVRVTVKEETSA